MLNTVISSLPSRLARTSFQSLRGVSRHGPILLLFFFFFFFSFQVPKVDLEVPRLGWFSLPSSCTRLRRQPYQVEKTSVMLISLSSLPFLVESLSNVLSLFIYFLYTLPMFCDANLFATYRRKSSRPMLLLMNCHCLVRCFWRHRRRPIR